MSALGPLLPVWELDRPRHMRDELCIIWDADGQPFGLVIDGRYYRVRPSPGLRCYPGNHEQTLFERPPREPIASDDSPPAA